MDGCPSNSYLCRLQMAPSLPQGSSNGSQVTDASVPLINSMVGRNIFFYIYMYMD